MIKDTGKILTALRGNKSLQEVAAANGISTAALKEYESGGRLPRDEVKTRLAKYYSCSIAEIF